MGRGKRQGTTTTAAAPAAPATPLDEREQAVLAAIPRGGMDARGIHVADLTPQAKKRLLDKLESRGLVERYPNPHGPETPIWWSRLPQAPEGFAPTIAVAKGLVFDRYEAGQTPMTFIELTGEVNEHGCAGAYLKAGPHNARKTWVPLHLLESGFYHRRKRSQVTAWSSQFSCPNHGECSEDMVTTKKTCAMCGALLNRH